LVDAAHLAHVLQRRRPHLLGRRRWIEVVQDPDVAAHQFTVTNSLPSRPQKLASRSYFAAHTGQILPSPPNRCGWPTRPSSPSTCTPPSAWVACHKGNGTSSSASMGQKRVPAS